MPKVPTNTTVDLASIPTTPDLEISRDQAKAEFKDLRDELIDVQNKLYAEGKQKLLVVLQAMDCGGKDSTIRKVFRGVNPQGVRVTSFKRPTGAELARDFLWRVHKAVPGSGMIGVFNRSHYEDVLVVRVNNLVPEEQWRQRFAQINAFEQLLMSGGTRIVKLYLHISRTEQKERLEDRLNNSDKHWKFDIGDLRKRDQWYDYMGAYEDMLSKTSTDSSPWYVIPADQKWYRNLVIARILTETLRDMNPQYPTQEDDLSGITIPD